MIEKNYFASFVRENKIIILTIVLALFLIEVEIVTIAAMKSGHKSILQVYNNKGNTIYETNAGNLNDFNKTSFEKTFGPLEKYEVKLVTRNIPFPFRAWFVAAAGIPLGIILLLAFILKVYLAVFYNEPDKTSHPELTRINSKTGFEKTLNTINQLNVFLIGFLLLVAVLSYWVIPNFLVYIGKIGLKTLIDYKWIFIIAGSVLLAFFIWLVYLKYLLTKKSIDCQTEIEKYRIQLEYDKNSVQKLLPGNDIDFKIIQPALPEEKRI